MKKQYIDLVPLFSEMIMSESRLPKKDRIFTKHIIECFKKIKQARSMKKSNRYVVTGNGKTYIFEKYGAARYAAYEINGIITMYDKNGNYKKTIEVKK